MTMPTFESGMPQSMYTLSSLRVARWDGTNYGDTVLLAEGQTLQFTPQADTDEKKAYGRMMRLWVIWGWPCCPTHPWRRGVEPRV